MINIHDSGRLLYKNAKIRAWNFATPTLGVPFFDADGVNLGFTLNTNALGYVIYGVNQQRANGYFVEDKSILEVSLDNGVSWGIQWTVDAAGVSAGAGRYLTKDGVEVWNANATNDYTPSYDHLTDTPVLKTWKETEYTIYVQNWGQVFEIPEYVTVLRIQDHADAVIGGQSPRKAIHLTFKRYGQQVVAVNETTADVGLYHTAIPVYVPNVMHPAGVCVLQTVGDTTVLGVTGDGGDFAFHSTSSVADSTTTPPVDKVYKLYLSTDWGRPYTIPTDVSIVQVVGMVDPFLPTKRAIKLIFTRPGQVCSVVNMYGYEVQLWDVDAMSTKGDPNGKDLATSTLLNFGDTVVVSALYNLPETRVQWHPTNSYVTPPVVPPIEQVVDLGSVAQNATLAPITIDPGVRLLSIRGEVTIDNGGTLIINLTGGDFGVPIMIWVDPGFYNVFLHPGSTTFTTAISSGRVMTIVRTTNHSAGYLRVALAPT